MSHLAISSNSAIPGANVADMGELDLNTALSTHGRVEDAAQEVFANPPTRIQRAKTWVIEHKTDILRAVGFTLFFLACVAAIVGIVTVAFLLDPLATVIIVFLFTTFMWASSQK